MPRSSKLCIAPWKALSVNGRGDVSPDAQFSGVLGNIKQQSLAEILNGEKLKTLRQSFVSGEFGKGCESCEKKEAAVGHSRRIFFDHTITNHHLENKDFQVGDQAEVMYLDLNLSNKCNLKCRMCNSVSSTSWFAEDRALNKLEEDLHRPKDIKSTKLELNEVMRLFEDSRPFQNLKVLALRGGEPLLEVENIKVLERLVEMGISKNVILDISTNGTVVSKPLLDLMSEFKEVELYISVEGHGELYNYIRGGEKFSVSKLEEHIQQFRTVPNLTVMFAVCVSIYNIFYLSELWDWFDSIYEPYDEITMTNAVVRPAYLNFQILPREMKLRALEKLEQSNILEGPHHSGRRLLGDSGKQLIRESLKKEVFSKEEKLKLLNQFKSYNCMIDEMRQTRLVEVAPDLRPIFLPGDLEGLLAREGTCRSE